MSKLTKVLESPFERRRDKKKMMRNWIEYIVKVSCA